MTTPEALGNINKRMLFHTLQNYIDWAIEDDPQCVVEEVAKCYLEHFKLCGAIQDYTLLDGVGANIIMSDGSSLE